MKKNFIITICSIILIIGNANAQIKKLFVELGVSANSYKGSLNEGFGNYASSYHLGVRFCKKKILNGRINLSYGNIDGQTNTVSFINNNGKIIYPLNYFNTSLFTVNYEAIFNIWSKKKYLIYLGAGAGIMRFDVKDENGNSLVNNLKSRDSDEDYSNITTYFPVFIGFNYIMKNDVRIGFQTQLLNPMTDYLDNTKNWSPNVTGDNVLALKFFMAAPIYFGAQ